MTRTVLLPRPILKEFRALSLAWYGCGLVLIVPSVVLGPPQLFYGGRPGSLAFYQVMAYLLGAPLLGALSIGREYMHRTLDQMLTLPVRRRRLLFVKLAVLGTLLLSLSVAAHASLFDGLPPTDRLAASVLPVLCGLFVAPWLTMVCRNAVAGVVFTVAIPLVLALVGSAIGARIEAERTFTTWFLYRATLVLCAIGAVATWRTFMRLEAIGSVEAASVQWPRFGRRASSASPSLTLGHPIPRLVAKELRLQQFAFTVAGFYLLGWVAIALLKPEAADVYSAFSAVYAGLLGMLIGSVASAEERDLGTIEWQVLQPTPMWRQWTIKVGVALGLALLLGIGLPVLLDHLGPAANGTPLPRLRLASTVLLLTAGSLYVSSLCASAAFALLLSLPAVFGALWFQMDVLRRLEQAVRSALWRPFDAAAHSGIAYVSFGPPRLVYVLDLLPVCGLIVMLAGYSLANHCSSERSYRRICKQTIAMGTFAMAGVTLLSAAAAMIGR